MTKLTSLAFALLLNALAFSQSLCTNGSDSLLVTSTIISSPQCAGQCDGIAMAQATLGSGVYTYSWSGPGVSATGPTVTGLCAGVYTVNVTDAITGLSCVDSIIVVEPSPLFLFANVVPPTCPGACDGLLVLTSTGGTFPHLYSVNGSSWTTNTTYPNICEGVYTIQAQDANGCIETQTITVVASGAAFSATAVTLQNELTVCDGVVDVTISGGVGPFLVQWYDCSTHASVGTGAPLSNVCSGDYYAVVYDQGAANCPDTTGCVTVLPQTCNIVSTAFTTSETCFGACDGTVFANFTGGLPPYQVSIDGVNWFTATSAYTWPNVCAGTYILYVQDMMGCVDSTTLAIVQPGTLVTAAPAVVQHTTSPLCQGMVTANVTGGIQPYTYQWFDCSNGTQIGSTQTVGNLCAGDYALVVTDTTGCMDSTACVTVLDSGTCPVQFTENIIPETCAGLCNGSVTIIGFGGVGPYLYSFNLGPYTPQNTFSGLCAGTYDVTVLDSTLNCSHTHQVVISSMSNINAVAAIVQNEVIGCDAVIGVNVTGGVGPYMVQWFDCATDSAVGIGTPLPNVCTGDYYAVVYDQGAGNCPDTTQCVSVLPVTCNIVGTGNMIPASCPNVCDGQIQVFATGGTSGLYEFSINGGFTWQTANLFSGLCFGTYVIYIRDAVDTLCSTQIVMTVGQGTGPVLTTQVQSHTQSPACTGSILASATGGTPGYSYEWYDCTSGTLVDTTSQPGSLCAGDYFVFVYDVNGCADSAGCITILDTTLGCNLVATGNSIDPTCSGNCDGLFYGIATGGSGSYEYSLDGVNWQPTPNFNGLCAGVHIFYVQDLVDTTCSTVYTFVLNPGSGPTASASVVQHTDSANCNGVVTVTATGGAGNYTYVWTDCSNGNVVGNTATVTGLCAGDYAVTVYDGNGCFDSTACITVLDTVGANPCANISMTPYVVQHASNGQCNGSLDATITGTSGQFNAYWIDCNTGQIAYTWYQWPAACSGQYALVVQDIGYGCSDTSTCITVIDSTAGCTLVATGNSIDPTCAGTCDGQFYGVATGGSGSYQYSLDGVNWQPTPNFNGLCAGVHIFYVQDLFNPNCTTVYTFVLNQGSGPVASASVVQHTDSANCNGVVTVTATGGAGNYTYVWTDCSNGTVVGNTATVTGLCAGDYAVTVYDGNGCFDSTACITVLDTVGANPCANISMTPYVVQHASNGQCNGSLDATITGTSGQFNAYWIDCNTGQIAYTWYQWPAACPGQYALVVQDFGYGCSDTSGCITVIDSTAGCNMVATATYNYTGCGACTGLVTAAAAGGSGNYEYSLDGVNWQMSPTFQNVCDGVYVVHARDLADTTCYAVYTIQLFGGGTLSLNIDQVVNASVSGGQDGEIHLSANGGTSGYLTFSIDGGATWNGAGTDSTYIFTGLAPGTYYVCVHDSATSCTVCDTVVVDVGTGIFSASHTQIELYPNPNDGRFQIRLPDGLKEPVVRVFDPTGRLVYDQVWYQNGLVQLDLTGKVEATGLYLLDIQSFETRYTARFIVR